VDAPDSLLRMQKLCEFDFQAIFNKAGGRPAWDKARWNCACGLSGQTAEKLKI
jgi:hypothetical protein